jgi:hypothetical protein
MLIKGEQMSRLWRVGVVVAGLSALAACKAGAQAPKSVVLDDFERAPLTDHGRHQFDPAEAIRQPMYPNHDFDVATSGYATLTPLTKDQARAAKDKPLYKFIQGKTAAQVRFSVPTDYKKKDDERFPLTWETGFSLSTDSHTPLTQTDWSAYRFLDFRAYNPGPRVQVLHIRYNDAMANSTGTAVSLPLGESEVELGLDQLAAARLNPANIRGVSLYLDTVSQAVDPVIDFDQLALYDTDAATRQKLAAEEGAEESSDDEDWDSDEDEAVRKVAVVHPGDLPSAGSSQALSTTAAP